MSDKSPKRIQRKRTKGWAMPVGAIYVGRPGPFGNPYAIGGEVAISGVTFRIMTREQAVGLFRTWLLEGHSAEAAAMRARARRELRGHDLACWCPPSEPCHADVLIALANGRAA